MGYSLTMKPSIKRHITEQDVSSIHHTLNSLTFDTNKPIQRRRRGKKRKFNEMNVDNIGCKDKMNKLCDLQRGFKKIKLWNPKTKQSFGQNVNDTNDAQKEMNLSDNETKSSDSELIPSNIKYAEFMNNYNEHPLIHTLYRNDNPLHTTLNEHNGALMIFREPKDSWKDLIQKCCTNEGDACCEIGKLKLEDLDNDNDDIRMKETRKKRPIRLHTSYSYNGMRPNYRSNVNSTQLKKMANKCYVSTLNKDK